MAQGQEDVDIIKHRKETEEVLEGGNFNASDAHASFVTYFRVPDDETFRQITSKINAHVGDN